MGFSKRSALTVDVGASCICDVGALALQRFGLEVINRPPKYQCRRAGAPTTASRLSAGTNLQLGRLQTRVGAAKKEGIRL